jgi:hypothetical protein
MHPHENTSDPFSPLLAAQGFPPIIPPAEPMRRDHFSEKKSFFLPVSFPN